MGPNVTLLRDLFLGSSLSTLALSNDPESKEVSVLLSDLFLVRFAGSSTSWMEAREDFLEDLRYKEFREGMGVGTFSRLETADTGVAGRDGA